MTDLAAYSLNDQFGAESGTVSLSGVQAAIRTILDQARADARVGRNVAGMVAGYRGSPVGGLDAVYERHRDLMKLHDIDFVNGVNEELGATIVWGSQQSSRHPTPLHDGVLGMWYGKGPGLDRAGDALRHANYGGVGPTDGVLAIVGDDPACKSSSIPSASEYALADLAMPTLYPGSVQEVLDYGRFGYEMSRISGAWIALKLHTDVADGSSTVDVCADRLSPNVERFHLNRAPWTATASDHLAPPNSVHLEHEALFTRPAVARHFARLNGLDTTHGASDAWLGIVAAGKPYFDLRTALDRLGAGSDDALASLGIRILKPGLIWPLDGPTVKEFAAGVEVVMVVEEKRPFVEEQLRNLLYGVANAPAIVGSVDSAGANLVPNAAALEPDLLVEPLRRVLAIKIAAERLVPERTRIPVHVNQAELPSRTPYFCSGCPHNRSTVVPEGSVAGGGIGCHSMALWTDERATGVTAMGLEGAQWVGQAPFVEEAHRFQNLGDGTLAHSGILAIRQSISAGTNITYKILYNNVVAMTGGQDAAGAIPVPDLTRQLATEGVAQIVVVSDEPDKYPLGTTFAPGCRVEHRDKLDDVQRELREVTGTTVLIYDQGCAAELRRDRKRGRVETPTKRIVINEAVCDGCGHCGEISNCMSVHPVDTPLGRKTRIHQESCNYDYSCVDGNCPAFLTVTIDPTDVAGPAMPGGRHPALSDLSVPEPVVPESGSILTVGIGGTGVVTINQMLITAALLDGKVANSLDQVGLAQKGGPVVSHLRVDPSANSGASRIEQGGADAYLVFDVIAGVAEQNLVRTSTDRTTAVVAVSRIPTGHMVSAVDREGFPDTAEFVERIEQSTKATHNVWLDAEAIAKRVFQSQSAANLIVLGAACQAGLLPVSSKAIAKAIELNAAAVTMNLEAFALGRRLASEPGLAEQIAESAMAHAPPTLNTAATQMLDQVGADAPLAETLRWRIPELVAYQGEEWARTFTNAIAELRQAEVRARGAAGGSELTVSAARQLAKFMTYKDEYEVARLHRRPELTDEIRDQFGHNAKIDFMLQPPTLNRIGNSKKISVPERAATVMFAGLAKMKRLRGHRFDPFGNTEERRLERDLIDDYQKLLADVATRLTSDNYQAAVELVGLADQVRGFSDVKLANVARYRPAVESARNDWSAS